MRILHINTSDVGGGGAALAAWRLHEQLVADDVDSRLLVYSKRSGDARVERVKIPRRDILSRAAYRRLGYDDIHLKSTYKLVDHPWVQDADVLHLHNLHGNYFNYQAIPKLAAGKAVVWTLHDMWSLTGHCAYSLGCGRWEHGCGQCPDLAIYPSILRDTTAKVWRARQAMYKSLDHVANVKVVAPSQWLAEAAKRGLLGRFDVECLPYGLDLDVYQPRGKADARHMLGLPKDKWAILCVAAAFNSPFKGLSLLMDALKLLPAEVSSRAELWVVGDAGSAIVEQAAIPVRTLGYNSGDRVKSVLYSAADLLVLPSRADNLPLVLQESLACGLPMVGFDVGGVSDVIRDGMTGLLAKAEDAGDLAAKLAMLLPDEAQRMAMSGACRAVAESDYEIEHITSRYRAIYKSLIRVN